ncbi:unnamed protein product [Ceratitis capitata]|uniref:(Mediterranean fruit fly) hypothetical protein n=1 Tax=Ceratitis capitata TaxID=7213 RepID=A0A811UAW6_CERCA|nr:unnamed protein product [Ceratitis capitata]
MQTFLVDFSKNSFPFFSLNNEFNSVPDLILAIHPNSHGFEIPTPKTATSSADGPVLEPNDKYDKLMLDLIRLSTMMIFTYRVTGSLLKDMLSERTICALLQIGHTKCYSKVVFGGTVLVIHMST